MYKRFKEFIASEDLFQASGKILLGVSGGIDSMVMLSLFLRTGYQVSAAHCNFCLRGKESDADELFVSEFCKLNSVPFHSKPFDTVSHARESGISVQMAARELRYEWFDQLTTENNFTHIGIAHNKNDVAETFLINLIRGTGIRGLAGIRIKTGKIIRPLLFADRNEITQYATNHGVPFREDSSNIEIKYRRNRIRHRIIPEFQAISPHFISTLNETTNRIRDIETIYTGAVNRKFDEICIKTRHGYQIKIDLLTSLNPLFPYLYEFLRRWNFPREMVPDVISSLKGPPGKQFYSPTHRLVKDRDYLLVTTRERDSAYRFYIEEEVTGISHPLKLRITRTENHPAFIIPKKPEFACLDLDLLHFPLILRKWQNGDYFQPLGMKGLKKLSDFFIDNKFSIIEKEETWLLASGNKVVWIAGHRIDHRFRITGRTRNIFMVQIIDRNPA
jgi:tRNA(Ile)-lysidine synthase